MNAVVTEFDRFALTYHKTCDLQKEIANYLLSPLKKHYKCVLDLGSGSGAVCHHFKGNYDAFIGIDASLSMCDLHPKGTNIAVIHGDFDEEKWDQGMIDTSLVDLITSASSLQWSKDPERLISRMQHSNADVAIAVFTSETFKDLHQMVGYDSFLPRAQRLSELFREGVWEIKRYTKEFSSTRELFEYVKKSGFNGRGNGVSPMRIRTLIREDKIKSLEFEVFYGWLQRA